MRPNARTINEDEKRYFLYVGFNMGKDMLKKEGERLEFLSARERCEFRDALQESNPKNMAEVMRIYKNIRCGPLQNFYS